MASQNKPEFQPMLAPGRHHMSLAALEALCVTPYATSSTRPGLLAEFAALIRHLEAGIGVCDVWVDGSFITEKDDPDDIDLTITVPSEVLERIAATDQAVVQQLFAMVGDGLFSPGLHIFVLAVRPVGHPDHPALELAVRDWAQWWSVTREAWVKGFAVIRLGESDVALRLFP
jgi:hypothetical protein